MRDMATIADLQCAQEEDPDLVEQYLERIPFLPDLKKYLRWLHDNGQSTRVVSNLRRQSGRTLGIHPSAACKKNVCPMRLFYDCTGKLEPVAPYNEQSQEIWDLGTMLHDRMQTFLKAMYGPVFNAEVPLDMPEIMLVGHTDGLWSFEPYKKLGAYRIVLELKSIKEGGEYGWTKIQEKPFPDNVRQAHFYMKAADVPFASVTYMNKNNGEMKEHIVTYDPDIWADLMRVVVPVVEAVRGGKPVQEKPGWSCKYCDYLHGCGPGRNQSRAKTKGVRTWTGRRV